MNAPHDPAWRELTEFEAKAARRFALQCEGLGDATCTVVATEFSKAFRSGLAAMVQVLGRFPDDCETTKLGLALVDHFNTVRIPALRQGTLH